ncbi:unnamed protein product [Effrenium voratum]|uniref:Uncharacterized protein n=1 Tax=Effrenium voratum TaxID=2562239 RepID=A0AA36JF54_9DINO|nr:unnamed protein product [Effrenium voratum]CAJ1452676.1 unnamed protein product [Effrenium voratum]
MRTLAVLLLVIGGTFSSAFGAASGVFERWLAHQTLTLPKGTVPPFEADVKILLGNVHVKAEFGDLECHGFRVAALESVPEASAIRVALRGVAANCSGQIEYSTSLGLSGYAGAVLTSENSSAQLRVASPAWDMLSPQPPELKLDACSGTVGLRLQITSGSFWTEFARYLPGFIKKLEDLAGRTISEQLCGPVLDVGTRTLKSWMNRSLAEARSKYQAEEVPVQQSWVDWAEHELTQGIVMFQEQFLEPRKVYDWLIADRCIVGADTVCFKQELCVAGNDSSCVVSEEAGHMSLDVRKTTWGIRDFDLSPLAAQNASLAANLSASSFQIYPVFNLSFAPQGERGSFELVSMNLSLAQVHLGANLTVAVDKLVYSTVKSFQYLQPDCLARAVQRMQLNRMDAAFQLQQIGFSTDSNATLLSGAASLAEQMLGPQQGLRNFSALLLRGFAQNQFATSWNGSIAHWLGTHRPRHCPLPKGEGVYGPTGRTLIRPNFGRACCWLAACTAALGILMAFWAPRSRWWFRGALCQSEVVPKHLAVSLPVMIMACLFFLLGSNYLLMAQTFVNLEQAPNFVWNAFQVMVYSLFYSIDALYYEAHLQAMSWVLLCFSAILPYVKLLLMLLGWLAPKNLLPLRIRSFILVLMDDIGKFSLVDVFTVQILSGVFHVEIFGEQNFRMALRTRGELGFAAFVCATVVSLVIGHLCRHYNEKSQKSSRSPLEEQIELRASELQAESLGQPLSGNASARNASWSESLIVPALWLTLALSLAGCILPAYSVHLKTIFGPLGQSRLSLFQFAFLLPSFAEHPLAWTSLFNQATFVVFALGVNFLQILMLLVLRWRKTPKFKNIDVRAVAHCLGAWAAMDVALISMFLTMVELKQSDFVHLDDPTKEKLSRLVGMDLRGGDKGLSVDVQLQSGTFILFAAVLMHAWISRAALRQD